VFLKFVAIADNAYFAQHATFPGVSGNLTAPGTPWILYGGSLAGAQTAFSIKAYGDILYGGIASSGVIKVVLAYPQWWVGIVVLILCADRNVRLSGTIQSRSLVLLIASRALIQ
jgi:hypothetical protein